MELERVEHDDPRNMRYMQDGKPVMFDELKNKEEVGMA
jgi:hypothetical protein